MASDANWTKFYDALGEARAALTREIADKQRKAPGGHKNLFSDEEIASAVSYRQGIVEGLKMAEEIF